MNFEQFKRDFSEQQSILKNAVDDYPMKDRRAYGKWLADTYHYVQFSTRILALASGHMPQHLTLVANRFIEHAAEEKDHDKLILADLKELGYKIDDFQVSHEMQIYFQSLFYWISPAGNPVGLIGWVLSLEGMAMNCGKMVQDTVEKEFGSKVTNFLQVHSDLDPDHVDKALQITSTLDADDLLIINKSMEMYTKQYVLVLKECAQHR